MWRNLLQSILSTIFDFDGWPAKIIGAGIVGLLVTFILYKTYDAGYDHGEAKMQAQWDAANTAIEESSKKAVEDALREANAKAEAEKEEIRLQQEAAVAAANQAIEDANRKAASWKSRYQAALKEDASCQKWSEEKIPCPVN